MPLQIPGVMGSGKEKEVEHSALTDVLMQELIADVIDKTVQHEVVCVDQQFQEERHGALGVNDEGFCVDELYYWEEVFL